MRAAAYKGNNHDFEEDHALSTMITPEEQEDDKRVGGGDQHTRKER
jgi:hypothetical protein